MRLRGCESGEDVVAFVCDTRRYPVCSGGKELGMGRMFGTSGSGGQRDHCRDRGGARAVMRTVPLSLSTSTALGAIPVDPVSLVN